MYDPRAAIGFLSICLCVGAALTAAPALADDPPTALFDLRLQGVEGALPSQLETGNVILERTDVTDVPPHVLPAKVGQTVRVPVPSRWLIRFEIPGLWGQQGPLEADGSTPTAWIFNLRPAGRVTGRLTSRALPLPRAILVFGELISGARAESPCPLGPKGDYDCSVPAGAQDVLIGAGAFAPVRFRGQKVPAGKALALPTTELQPGASLVGRVVTRDGTVLEVGGPASVKVYRFLAAPEKSLEPPKPLAESPLGADGSFAFVGLEPGTVLLEVTKPGFSPARAFPLELPAGAEVALPDPLELTRPFEVVVEVNPPTDIYGLPWRVTLQRRPAAAGASDWGPEVEGPTDAEGRFRVAGQSAGQTRLEVADGSGNRYYSGSNHWLAEGSEARVVVELPLIEIRGELTYDDQPVAATLWFGGRNGAQRVGLTSDEEGRFVGVLPKPGTWRVDVITESFNTRVKVPVEPRLGKAWAEVKVRLPDTLVFGRVIDSADLPVADVTVTVDSAGWPVHTRTDSQGRFEAKAITPGPSSVVAKQQVSGKPLLVSDELLLELREDQPLGPIELRLRDVERLTGTVYRGNQPVPGAVVGLWARGASGHIDQATTDAEGAFSVRVDPKTPDWIVTVLAPGATLTVFQRVNDGTLLEIQVEPEGGELTLELPLTSEQLSATDLELSLTRNGVQLALFWLVDWLRVLGRPFDFGPDIRALTVPQLAPGIYTACLTPHSSTPVSASSTPAPGLGVNCRSGQLTAGGRLKLSLPKPGAE